MVVGRQAELSALTGLLEEARRSRPGSLLVVGEPGIGKTALLEASRDVAADMGFATATVTGVPGERAVPGAALSLLAARLAYAGAPEDSVAPLWAALRGPVPATAPVDLLLALAGAARDRPLLLVADDVQWWDGTSLHALLFALRRLRHDAVVVLAAGRTEALCDQGLERLPRLTLGPVPVGDAPVLARTVSPDITDGVAVDLWRAVAGNTLAVVETVANLEPDVRSGRTRLPALLPVGGGVTSQWAGETATLPEASLLALAIMAVDTADDPPSLAAAFEVAGVSARDLEPAEAARMVRADGATWRFRHPLVRHAILAAIPATAERAGHAAFAAALDERGVSGQRLARRAGHLAAATVGPDATVAERLAIDGAELARQGSWGAAADVLAHAARLQPDREQGAGLLARAAALTLDDYEDDHAIALADEGLALEPAGPVRGSLLRTKGTAVVRVRDVAEGIRLLQASLDSLAGPERLEAVRSLLYAAHQSPDRCEMAGSLTEVLGEPSTLSLQDRFLVGHNLFALGRSREAMQLMRSGFAQLDPSLEAASGMVTDNIWNAGLSVGFETSGMPLHRICRELCVSEDPARRCDGLLMAALLHFWEGAWDRADAEIGEHREICEALGRVDLTSDALVARQESHRGRPEVFASALARALSVDTSASLTSWVVQTRGSVGDLAVTLGRPAEALQPYRDSFEADHDVQMLPYNGFADHGVALVEALMDLGRRDEAADVLEVLTRRMGTVTNALGEGLVARASAAVADDESADALYCRAEERIEKGVHSFSLAETRLRHARWLRRHRRRGEAADRLRLALTAFETMRCDPWARRCHEELSAVGVDVARHDRYDATACLTVQERRVAEAAAEGLSNQDVARRLFLSPKTVEVHLTHAYRKLDIRGRPELARALDPLSR